MNMNNTKGRAMTQTQILKAAIKALQTAEKNLDKLAKMNANFHDFPYYRNKVSEIISCDHGQSGLVGMLRVTK